MSWSGDLGTVVISIVDGNNNPTAAMNQFASDADLSADIAAVVVGDRLNGSGRQRQQVTDEVQSYDTAKEISPFNSASCPQN
ncbi:MAG: hypothetical protein MJA27_06610 [Pseudanabaenales cyanobacterium]|nr:hypothetical protein [Pseudanabaenales cyanobacterium]